jgi:CHASE1-domain containing sensor protein
VVSEHTPPRATLLLPWLVLIAMLSVTWWQWDHERQSNRKELRSTFEFALLDTVSRIEQRESAYEQMLRGMQGLFASTDLMARDPFNRYVKTLQLDANFSGVQGLGVIQYVAAKQKNQHITAMRQHGLASYALTPSGTRDSYVANHPECGWCRPIVSHPGY